MPFQNCLFQEPWWKWSWWDWHVHHSSPLGVHYHQSAMAAAQHLVVQHLHHLLPLPPYCHLPSHDYRYGITKTCGSTSTRKARWKLLMCRQSFCSKWLYWWSRLRTVVRSIEQHVEARLRKARSIFSATDKLSKIKDHRKHNKSKDILFQCEYSLNVLLCASATETG